MKKKWLLITLLAFMAGMGGNAWSAVSDALTVTITPNADYGVDIDTGSVSLSFTPALDTDGNVVLPATVTINSSFATTELSLDADLDSSGPGTTWQFAANATTSLQDRLRMWVIFTNTSVTTYPGNGAFDNTNDYVSGAAQAVGGSGNGVGFEDGTAEMDNLAPGTARHMWIRFRTPPTTTSGSDTAQLVKVTLTAGAPL